MTMIMMEMMESRRRNRPCDSHCIAFAGKCALVLCPLCLRYVCHVPPVSQKAKGMKTNNAEAGGGDDDEESLVSSSVADAQREKKKEKLVLKKPPEEKKENEYKQWYKSYVIKVTTAPTVAAPRVLLLPWTVPNTERLAGALLVSRSQEPSGKEHITTNLNEFCKQHGLVAEKMDQVALGQLHAHKKWRVNVLSDGSSDESDSD